MTLRSILGALLLVACGNGPAPFVTGDAGSDLGVVTPADVPGDGAVGRCQPGVDSDFDGVDNDVECMLGTDPFNHDTDGDGLRDGQELRYPRVCVAADRGAQRRPPELCRMRSDCRDGEDCVGLNPRERDSDGDGVPDGMEDPNGDGAIDAARGETDPRLFDTDGDGNGDGMSGLAICRRDGLVEPVRVPLPGGTVQLGLDPMWRMATRSVAGTQGAAVLLDLPGAQVAALAVERRADSMDVRTEAAAAELAVTMALGATPVLVGQRITTHEMNPAVNSLYRVAGSASPGTLRDRLADRLAGVTATMDTPMYPPSAETYVELTTVLRVDQPRVTFLVTAIPRAIADDPMRPAGTLGDDLVNTTGLAEGTRTLDSRCERFTADREATVDFLWEVDTSGSMSDDQERLGNTATRFFTTLDRAGVDFRVGVLEASATWLDLDRPGFQFINGADPGGARLLAWRTTVNPYMMDRRDTLRPYPVMGGTEEPVAGGILAYESFRARAMMGALDPDRRLREGARVVAFFVTDEPGSNDDRAFARTPARWGADYPTRLRTIIDFYRRNEILTFGLILDGRTDCAVPNVVDLPKCVILGNGGAFIPITTATDAEVSAAMLRIVESVAGATSQFQLERTPLSSTLQVRVDGRPVPRSRHEGFDYDAASRSVLFYGGMYRPRRGSEVVVSYRVWAGSLG
jgi:hypothetical protein